MGAFEWKLDNWIRWCRKRNWLPLGHVSQIYVLIKRSKRESLSASDMPIPIYEQDALKFNGYVMLLPKRHRDVFLLNHLDKGVRGQMILRALDAKAKYKLAGLGKTTFYERAKEADNMVKRWANEFAR